MQLEPEGACSGVRQLEDFSRSWPSVLQAGLAAQQDLRAGCWYPPSKELPSFVPCSHPAALPGTIPQPGEYVPPEVLPPEKKETGAGCAGRGLSTSSQKKHYDSWHLEQDHGRLAAHLQGRSRGGSLTGASRGPCLPESFCQVKNCSTANFPIRPNFRPSDALE